MIFVIDQRDGEPMLKPFDRAALDFIEDQVDGEPIEVEVYHPRDMIEHRRIFAQIGELAKALHRSHSMMRAELLYATGNFSLVGELSGLAPVIAVNSMSRHAMTDRDLHLFWNEALEVINSRLLARIDNPAERERLAEMFAPEPA